MFTIFHSAVVAVILNFAWYEAQGTGHSTTRLRCREDFLVIKHVFGNRPPALPGGPMHHQT